MSQVRIVGGRWRSRRLDVLDLPGLRPTPDRVRETLFNWLGQELDGWRCLDLFAGSGALGFEAASRGAAEVVMVERDPRAFSALEQAAQRLGAVNVRLVRGDALRFLQSDPGSFDLVLLDPPFQQDWLARLAPLLPPLLGETGELYVEAEYALTELAGRRRRKSGRAGQVHYQLLSREQP